MWLEAWKCNVKRIFQIQSVTIPGTNLFSELQADVPLMLMVCLELQLLLVGMIGLFQSDQDSVQKLLIVSLPLLGHRSELHVGVAPHVPHTLVLQLEEQMQIKKSIVRMG